MSSLSSWMSIATTVAAGDAGVLDRHVTEPADAEHGDDVRRSDLGHLDGLVGRDAGARQRRGIERIDPVRDTRPTYLAEATTISA